MSTASVYHYELPARQAMDAVNATRDLFRLLTPDPAQSEVAMDAHLDATKSCLARWVQLAGDKDLVLTVDVAGLGDAFMRLFYECTAWMRTVETLPPASREQKSSAVRAIRRMKQLAESFAAELQARVQAQSRDQSRLSWVQQFLRDHPMVEGGPWL